MKNERDSEKKIVSKFSEWTKATNQGELKVSSDKFFFYSSASVKSASEKHQ